MGYIALIALCLVLILFWPRRLEITRVVDGDSLLGMYRGRQVRVRLAGFDAPEYRQFHGREARLKLMRICQGGSMLVWFPGKDHYGRLLARGTIGWLPVSWRMVWAGYGWPDSKIGHLLALAPRVMRRGLWANRNRIQPSVYRKIYSHRQ